MSKQSFFFFLLAKKSGRGGRQKRSDKARLICTTCMYVCNDNHMYHHRVHVPWYKV